MTKAPRTPGRLLDSGSDVALARRLRRSGVAVARAGSPGFGGPARRVGDHPADAGVVVGGMRLMTRAEVEDATSAATVGAAAAKHLATLEPAHEDQLVGRRDVEV